MLAISWVVFSPHLAQLDWQYVRYRCLPTSSLLTKLDTRDWQEAGKVWRVLQRRAETRSTDDNLRQRIVAAGLRHLDNMQSHTPDAEIRGYLAQCYLNNQLTETQEAKFLNGLFKVELWVRDRVVAGDPVPYEEISSAEGLSRKFTVSMRRGPICIDDKEMKEGGNTEELGGCSVEYGTLEFCKPGRHVISRSVQFELIPQAYSPDGSLFINPNVTPIYKTTIKTNTQFEIVPTEPPDYIKLVQDDSLRDKIKDAIVVRNLHEGPDDEDIEVGMYVKSYHLPPTNVAFDIIVRLGDTEHLIDHVIVPNAEHSAHDHPCRRSEIQHNRWYNGGRIWKYTGPPFESCDVILRSNSQLARQTVDLYEIWEGELVYEDVDVQLFESSTDEGMDRGDKTSY